MNNQKIFVTFLVVVVVLFMFGFGPHLNPSRVIPSANPQVLEMNQNASVSKAISDPIVTQKDMEPTSLAGDAKFGDYRTDAFGRTLYTTTKNCSGDCLKTWLPYIADYAIAAKEGGIGTIYNKEVGVLQYAFNGKFLYYYAQDEKPGDIKGHGIGNVWFLAR